MSQAVLSAFVAQTARAVTHLAETDGQLLDRFVAVRDEAAFAELVHRHGPFVLAVCRRTTGDHHLAEDAFQAAFVVLARRAADVRSREGARPFLYGIAVRVAREARAMSSRRNTRESSVSSVPDRPAETLDPLDADTLRLLDEEVAALPDHLRTAVVLCELDGLGRKDAATQLGIAAGTLSSRLAKARKLLAERLRKRGVVLPAVGLGVLAGSVPVSAHLSSTTAAFASPTTAVPAAVVVLSNGVIRTMFAQKLRVVLSLAAVAVGVVVCAALATDLKPVPPTERLALPAVSAYVTLPADTPAPKDTPSTQPKGPNKLLICGAKSLTLVDPDGKNASEYAILPENRFARTTCVRLSPDGTAIANAVDETEGEGVDATLKRGSLHVRKLDEKEPGTDIGVPFLLFAWSPDGTEIAGNEFNAESETLEAAHFIVNVKTKTKTALKLPKNHLIADWSRDGKYFLTIGIKGTVDRPQRRLYLMNRDGTEFKVLTDEKQLAMNGRLSPDGTQLLYVSVNSPAKNEPEGGAIEDGPNPGQGVSKNSPAKNEPEVKDKPEEKGKPEEKPKVETIVLTIATGKKTKVQDIPLNAELQSLCWSPDGKKIAYSWCEIPEGKPEEVINKETEAHLVVCDPDGKNAKTIASEKGKGIFKYEVVDWR